MSKEIKRKEPRYEIGSTVEFEVDENYYQAVVLNSSMTGILIGLDIKVPGEIFTGYKIDIHLFDIFSDTKYTYPSKVIRKGEKEFAVEFLQPLTDLQNTFLDRWLNWQEQNG